MNDVLRRSNRLFKDMVGLTDSVLVGVFCWLLDSRGGVAVHFVFESF
jgi:hypothetical protein